MNFTKMTRHKRNHSRLFWATPAYCSWLLCVCTAVFAGCGAETMPRLLAPTEVSISMLEYDQREIVVYQMDQNGDPIVGAKCQFSLSANDSGLQLYQHESVTDDSGACTNTISSHMSGDFFVVVSAHNAERAIIPVHVAMDAGVSLNAFVYVPPTINVSEVSLWLFDDVACDDIDANDPPTVTKYAYNPMVGAPLAPGDSYVGEFRGLNGNPNRNENEDGSSEFSSIQYGIVAIATTEDGTVTAMACQDDIEFSEPQAVLANHSITLVLKDLGSN